MCLHSLFHTHDILNLSNCALTDASQVGAAADSRSRTHSLLTHGSYIGHTSGGAAGGPFTGHSVGCMQEGNVQNA
jgi:hypothetical protein